MISEKGIRLISGQLYAINLNQKKPLYQRPFLHIMWTNCQNEQECIPVGCISPASVAISGGVSAQGGVCVCLGCVLPPIACWSTYPSPVNRMTHRSKNITFPQLHLRAVKMIKNRIPHDEHYLDYTNRRRKLKDNELTPNPRMEWNFVFVMSTGE